MTLVHTLAGIAWDPQIRGILSVAVGVAVLLGSVYLLLGTNLGTRLGFLVSAAGFFGWLTLLGLVWWIYAPGIGPAGRMPSWQVVEANVGDLSQAALGKARPLDTSALPDPEELREATPEQFEAIAAEHEPELSGWKLIPESDPARGEAQAVVDAYLLDSDLAGTLGLETTSDYVPLYAFETGGKPERSDNSLWGRVAHKITSTLRITHPPHFALVQVQPTIDQEAEPGQPPPAPEPDPEAPVVSLILERELGQRRLPTALVAIGSGLVFAVLCDMLHRRDQRAAELRALPAGG